MDLSILHKALNELTSAWFIEILSSHHFLGILKFSIYSLNKYITIYKTMYTGHSIEQGKIPVLMAYFLMVEGEQI